MTSKSAKRPDAQPGATLLDDGDVRMAFRLALRLSATLDRAPGRCSRRDCRRTRRCRADTAEDGEPHCHAPIGIDVVDRAADMLIFVTVLARGTY